MSGRGRHRERDGAHGGAAAAAPAPGFARDRPVSRLESFSDGVFAISATLLVVSLDVPKTYGDLVLAVRGFVAFGLSFAMLLMIWFAHNAFFRRYGLADRTTALLNSALLFVVLFYVYPLKFLALTLVNLFSGHVAEVRASMTTLDDWVGLMTIYGIGFASVFALLALMYRHAHRCRELLQLSPAEALEARLDSFGCWIYVGVALLSIALAQLHVGMEIGLPGWIYGLVGPLSWWFGEQADRKRKAIAG